MVLTIDDNKTSIYNKTMPKALTPKFEVGEEVKEIGLPNIEGGAITRILYASDTGFRYVFEAKELDHKLKRVINGHKICTEEELEEFDES